MAKAKNANRLTQQEQDLLGYSFKHRLASLRSEKAHITRWINDDCIIIANGERVLQRTPDDGTDENAVRRSNALEMVHQYNLALDRHRSQLVAVDLRIAEEIQMGKRELAKRAAEAAAEVAEGSR